MGCGGDLSKGPDGAVTLPEAALPAHDGMLLLPARTSQPSADAPVHSIRDAKPAIQLGSLSCHPATWCVSAWCASVCDAAALRCSSPTTLPATPQDVSSKYIALTNLVQRGSKSYGERLSECSAMDGFLLRRGKQEVRDMFPPNEQVRTGPKLPCAEVLMGTDAVACCMPGS